MLCFGLKFKRQSKHRENAAVQEQGVRDAKCRRTRIMAGAAQGCSCFAQNDQCFSAAKPPLSMLCALSDVSFAAAQPKSKTPVATLHA